MYLHIGNKKSVRRREVIGIFDLDTATVTDTGKSFLTHAERAGKTEYADDTRVRLSRVSSVALAERFDQTE